MAQAPCWSGGCGDPSFKSARHGSAALRWTLEAARPGHQHEANGDLGKDPDPSEDISAICIGTASYSRFIRCLAHANSVLGDEEIVALCTRHWRNGTPKSRCRGRRGTPADVVLRLLILKHIRNRSYEVLEREVRAKLAYRDFTHVGGAKMPDAKAMSRWSLALGPKVLKEVHARIVKIAQDKGVTAGRRMRVDATVVETNIHHPTVSTLLGDGVRVLTSLMRKITEIAGAAGTQLGDRSRSVKLRLLEIGRVVHAKRPINQDKLKRRYRLLLNATSWVVGQAKRFLPEPRSSRVSVCVRCPRT